MAQPNPQYAQPSTTFNHALVTRAFDVPGYSIVRNYGLVRGIIVRSRSIVGKIGAAFQQIVGGNISIYTTSANVPASMPTN